MLIKNNIPMDNHEKKQIVFFSYVMLSSKLIDALYLFK